MLASSSSQRWPWCSSSSWRRASASCWAVPARHRFERLGRYRETVGHPGFRLVIPFIEKLRIVDLREQVVDVLPQEVITKDNVVVWVDAVVYFEPTKEQRVVYNITNSCSQ